MIRSGWHELFEAEIVRSAARARLQATPWADLAEILRRVGQSYGVTIRQAAVAMRKFGAAYSAALTQIAPPSSQLDGAEVPEGHPGGER